MQPVSLPLPTCHPNKQGGSLVMLFDVLFGWFAIVFLLTANVANGQDLSSDEFEKYLTDLKLNRLVIKHLEYRVDTELDQQKRLSIAGRLLDRYTDEMLSSQIEILTANQLSEKSTNLVNNYPALNTPQFKLAILQSRYLAEEKYFRVNRSVFSERKFSERKFSELNQPDPRPSNPTSQLSRWIELERELSQFNRELNSRYQELNTALQVNGDDWQLSQELTQTETAMLRADFLLGWTNYFCGVLQPTEQKQRMRQSDHYFRSFFQIDSREALTELSEKWFDFQSDWQIRGLLGMGMCQLGLDHPRQSQHCFELIRQHASEEMKTVLPIWEFNSRMFLGQSESALRLAEKFDRGNVNSNPEKIKLWTAVLDASVLTIVPSPDVAKKLERIGLAGLARNFQAPLIEQYLEHQSLYTDPISPNLIQLDSTELGTGKTQLPRKSQLPDEFLGNWVHGYLAFYHIDAPRSNAESKNSNTERLPDQTQAAREYLELAISQADAQTNGSDLARCRYLLATIDFRERSFNVAAQRFNQVSTALLPTDRMLAAEAQWFAALSLIELSRTQNRFANAAYAALEGLVRRFPESNYVSRAEFEKLRLKLTALPVEEAVIRLQRIQPNDSNYLLALLEIARYRFQTWLQSVNTINSDSRARHADLIEAVSIVRKEPRMPIDYQLAATFLQIDSYLRTEPLAESRVLDSLADAAELMMQLPIANSLIEAEYRYYQLQYCEKTRQLDRAALHANWILSHAVHTKFELPALIFLGKQIELEREISVSQNAKWLDDSIYIYQRMVDRLGQTQIQLKQSHNAQVALARLASLEQQAERYEAAESHFQQLVNDFPNQKQYLHGLATAKTQLQSFKTAAPLWRKLSASATAGSDEWFESKYYLIVCLVATDQPAARQLYQQTIRLSGEIPAAWQGKFAGFADKMGD